MDILLFCKGTRVNQLYMIGIHTRVALCTVAATWSCPPLQVIQVVGSN
jgi:hypothetical protein